ncbi:hypothetical protein MPTK1_4g23370 [Marchantia polymorpha subsp. ruderalis]|uniref:Protein kinase domain-containing protein n=2 Tax=Marchantia polymorpha TaxID=3197 RepID=A0AAF6BCY3_MARPO|nr:hypothetical protein MARPO_0020s0100 [Marchantia polymorpha]BBN09867.1 hypothetical protein Mp_4g23370 [Marchantia polymorpha subsp. ruderalis]|eukprot:PTQ44444.1 hypothetical protein MARPO_0020s0100 [Marchantia polymorpha]
MGTVASIIGGISAVIAFVGMAYKAYCCYCVKRDSPGSPKQAAAAAADNSTRCPRSICPLGGGNDLEQGVALGVPTTSFGSPPVYGSAHKGLTASSSGSNKGSKSSQKSPKGLPAVKSKAYSFEDMRTATQHFSNKIGEGRFGPVYHGRLLAQEVAVKVISVNSGQGASEFVKEVDLVANLHDENLVSLVGHCQESPHQMLIYKYVPNGTLRDHLHNQSTQPDRPALTWQQRLHIALDAAEALNYLHNVHKTGRPITIHGDLKPGNILLDDKLNGKLSDFGISKFASVDNSGVPTQVIGTPGYLDPEYSSTKQLTAKSDIYSLGVVLLELISGRSPIQCGPHGKPDRQWDLIDWARNLIKEGKLSSMVDPALAGRFEKHSMAKVAELAIFSVEPQGVNRPKACKLVTGLLEAIAMEQSESHSSPSSSGISKSSDQTSGTSARRSTSSQYSTADSEALISFPSSQCIEALEASLGPSSPANIIIQVDAR